MTTYSADLNVSNDNLAAGTVSGAPETGSATTVIGSLIVLACFAAPLFLTLPDTMDSAARSRPLISEASAADVREATFHERYPAQSGVEWTDTLDEAGLAQWRTRATD